MNRGDVHTAAGNLVLAHYVRSQIPTHLPAWQVSAERFTRLCEAGTEAGLAQSPAELELMVDDVVEVLPLREGDRGGAWIWLMQTRWLLAQRLLERTFPESAAA